MFFKTSNPSALAAWQKYQQDCQQIKDEAGLPGMQYYGS